LGRRDGARPILLTPDPVTDPGAGQQFTDLGSDLRTSVDGAQPRFQVTGTGDLLAQLQLGYLRLLPPELTGQLGSVPEPAGPESPQWVTKRGPLGVPLPALRCHSCALRQPPPQ